MIEPHRLSLVLSHLPQFKLSENAWRSFIQHTRRPHSRQHVISDIDSPIIAFGSLWSQCERPSSPQVGRVGVLISSSVLIRHVCIQDPAIPTPKHDSLLLLTSETALFNLPSIRPLHSPSTVVRQLHSPERALFLVYSYRRRYAV